MKLISILLLTFTLISPKSHAVMGGAVAISGAGPVGLTIALVGASKLGTGILLQHNTNRLSTKNFFGWMLVIAGVVLLDKNDLNTMEYNKISDAQALKLGIGETEQAAFNRVHKYASQVAKAIAKKCTAKLLKHKSNEVLEQSDIQELEVCTEKSWEAFRKKNSKLLNDDVYAVILSLRNQKI